MPMPNPIRIVNRIWFGFAAIGLYYAILWSGLFSENSDSSDPPLAQTLYFLPLGDSITEGCSGFNSYRRSLYFSLSAGLKATRSAATTVKFCGSQRGVACGVFNNVKLTREGTSAAPCYHNVSRIIDGASEGYCRPCCADDWPDYHEGHSGWTIDMLYRRNAIQLVVLHIGTNDIIKGEESQSPGSTIGELRKAVSEIHSLDPKTKIFIMKIIPWKPSLYAETRQKYNSEIESLGIAREYEDKNSTEMMAQLVRSGQLIVVASPNIDTSLDLFDGLHPNELGERKIADSFSESILSHI